MNRALLLSTIKLKGFSVLSFLEELQLHTDTKMSSITFYKKMKEQSDFQRHEIRDITNVLELTNKEIMDIFFADIVSLKKQNKK